MDKTDPITEKIKALINEAFGDTSVTPAETRERLQTMRDELADYIAISIDTLADQP